MKLRSQPSSSDPIVGLGPTSPKLLIYLPHTPNCDHLKALAEVRPAFPGELHQIGVETGNHWRKIINVTAKLGFAINDNNYSDWQSYRDAFLCREGSEITLIFGAKKLVQGEHYTHIISGHQYCESICKTFEFETLDQDFRLCRSRKVIDSPYFDYRQLSNIKLEKLHAYLLREQWIDC